MFRHSQYKGYGPAYVHDQTEDYDSSLLELSFYSLDELFVVLANSSVSSGRT